MVKDRMAAADGVLWLRARDAWLAAGSANRRRHVSGGSDHADSGSAGAPCVANDVAIPPPGCLARTG